MQPEDLLAKLEQSLFVMLDGCPQLTVLPGLHREVDEKPNGQEAKKPPTSDR